MNPLMSWALFGTGAVAIGGYYYYTENQKKVAKVREAGGRRRGSHARIDTKEKRTKGRDSGSSDHVVSDSADVPTATSSGAEGATKRKGKNKQPSKLSQGSAVAVKNEPKPDVEEHEDEGMDNAEFAQQFSSKQVGTDLKKPAGPAEKQMSKKQGKYNKAASEAPNGSAMRSNGTANLQQPSAASSTTGADTDDDLSPAYSPELGATSSAIPSAADVSDMLEAPAKGPSILNITAPINAQPVRQPKQQKPVQEPETKKQRQNRKKKEEQKVAREEGEKERRILLDKQLRTAREAEGRPAKNGLGISNPPGSNAWSKSTSINGGLKAPLSSANLDDAPLLDTFDDSQSSVNGAASLSATGANEGSSPQAASTSTFTSNTDLLSEEEQLRLISEMDSDNAWSTVNKGGKAKKNKAATAHTNLPNSANSSTNASNKKENQTSTSKFAALDVENSTEESTNMDKEEEAAVLTQPPSDVSVTPGNEKEKGKEKGKESEEVASNQLVDSASKGDKSRQSTTSLPVDETGSYTTGVGKSITGLAIPHFVHPCADETWITKDTPAENLPEGWYHYDNGCRYGNAKIPQPYHDYEREMQKLTKRASDGHVYPSDRRIKANLEKAAYDKCFLIYRTHVARTIDLTKWNKDNIKQHPAYESDWPWALIPHPSEGWSPGFHDASRDCTNCEDFSR